jgi:hypothetical protein
MLPPPTTKRRASSDPARRPLYSAPPPQLLSSLCPGLHSYLMLHHVTLVALPLDAAAAAARQAPAGRQQHAKVRCPLPPRKPLGCLVDEDPHSPSPSLSLTLTLDAGATHDDPTRDPRLHRNASLRSSFYPANKERLTLTPPSPRFLLTSTHLPTSRQPRRGRSRSDWSDGSFKKLHLHNGKGCNLSPVRDLPHLLQARLQRHKRSWSRLLGLRRQSKMRLAGYDMRSMQPLCKVMQRAVGVVPFLSWSSSQSQARLGLFMNTRATPPFW